jgi:AraC-like DNA-binding protein
MTSPGTTESTSVRRVRTSVYDVDEATEIVRARYADHVPSFPNPPGQYALDVSSDEVSTPWGVVSIDRLRQSAQVSAIVEPPRMLVLCVLTSGRMRFTCGQQVTGPGPLLCPTWAPFAVDCADVDVTLGVLDPDGVRRIGAELSGLDPSAVAFTGMEAVSPGHGQYVGALLHHLGRDVLGNEEVVASPLARAEVFHQLAVGLLVAFPNTTHAVGSHGSHGDGRSGPATVRRAVDFIEGHAAENIGLTEIAEVARLGPRGLQAAFRRHLGCTPLEYLRRARMDGAHRDLEASDPTRGATVASVAASWGFTHPGRFSVEYRRRFGHAPSKTLRS